MARKIHTIKIILFFYFLFFAQTVFGSTIDNVINTNQLSKQAVVAISVRDLSTGNVIYEKNPDTFVHPASTLKVLTSAAAYDYLGSNYVFKTAFYKGAKNKLYLKLSADPMFTNADLGKMIGELKQRNINTIDLLVIDDSIIDQESYGTGWQADDNANKSLPHMTPYTINQNLFPVKAVLNKSGKITIDYLKEYREPVDNYLTYGKENYSVSRDIFLKTPKIKLTGTVDNTTVILVPAMRPDNMFTNFIYSLCMQYGIALNPAMKSGTLPMFSSEEAATIRPIEQIMKIILQDSNNLAAEILLKHLGAVSTDKTGTTKDGLKAVSEFYSKKGLDVNNLQIVDGSGFSMNDYLTADFFSNALFKISKSDNFETFKSMMADSSQGTFKGRCQNLQGRLKVKTGTLANTSALAGYIRTNSGKTCSFAIMLDNIPNNSKPKDFEDAILQAISQM